MRCDAPGSPARRYYTFSSSVKVDGYVSNAYINATRDTVNYIKKGGIPLVVGEWSLAGELPTCIPYFHQT